MSWKKNNCKQILEIFFSALDFYFGFRWFCFNFSITDLKHQKWIGRYFLMHYNSQPTLQGRLLRSKIHSIETVGAGRVKGPGIWQISWAYLNQREQIMPTSIHEYLPSRFSDFPTARGLFKEGRKLWSSDLNLPWCPLVRTRITETTLMQF